MAYELPCTGRSSNTGLYDHYVGWYLHHLCRNKCAETKAYAQ